MKWARGWEKTAFITLDGLYFDVTIVHKSSRKHSDTDCLLRAPVDLPPQEMGEDAFFGVVTERDLAAKQHAYPELCVGIDHLEGR